MPSRDRHRRPSPARRFAVRGSAIHGRGVFALVDLPAGLRLMEYTGRRITRAEFEARDPDITASGSTYLFTLNDEWLVDGAVDGNSARFINHSCDPNCVAEVHVDVNGDPRRDKVWIETLRPIRAGEELTFEYGIELAVRHTARMKRIWECRCGARACTGTMLRPKR